MPPIGAKKRKSWRVDLSAAYSFFYLLLVLLPGPSTGYGVDVDVFPNRYAHEFLFEKMVSLDSFKNKAFQVVDPSTKRIFVGGVNHLYDIGFDEADHRLWERFHVITGPEDDSDECKGLFAF